MKKIVFICLLSLSVCICKPSNSKDQPSLNATSIINQPITISNQTAVKPSADDSTKPTIVTNGTEAAPAAPATHNEGAVNATTAVSGKENSTHAEAEKTTTLAPLTTKPTTKPEPTTHSTVTETAKITTTIKPNVSPTPSVVTPTATPADKHDVVVQARRFDGPSFIGGIILTLGMLAVGFMGFKYYKNQTERNYHTL